LSVKRPVSEEDQHSWRIYAPLQTKSGLLLVEWRYKPRGYRLGGEDGVIMRAAGLERLIKVLASKEPWSPGPMTWNPPVLLIGDRAFNIGKRGHLIVARTLNQMLMDVEALD